VSRKLILTVAVCLAAVTAAPAQQAAPPEPPSGISTPDPLNPAQPPPEPAAETSAPLLPKPIFSDDCVTRLYDHMQQFKKDWCLPVEIGAWNWEHVNTGGPNSTGYGIPPNQEGTYFWYLNLDPKADVNWGPITAIGGHAQLRFREVDKFRAFYSDQFWSYEAYLWADTPVGRFKAGQIVQQFGLAGAGDGSFWGTLLYFDGWNLNPDYGVAWENKWKVRDGFRIDQSAQFFFAEDGINGTVVGSQLESVPGAHMHSKAVLRLAPTWELADKSTFVLGLSGLTSEQEHVKADGRNNWVSAWAADATYSRKRWQVFGEVLQSYGVLNPMRYASGGPSERVSDGVLGAQYIWGPVTFRATASVGFDEDPSGYQTLFVPGVTVAMTKNIDFYAEYVRWDVYQAAGNKHSVFEDGIQLVINWRF
jgi:hypothetical protein